MTDPLRTRAAALADEFALFDDWTDRYAYLIDLGRALPPLPEADKTEAARVRGCQSKVWLTARAEPSETGPRMRFAADSDALITKGLVALLVRLLDGLPAPDVAAADVAALDGLGLREHLTPGRANGLAAMAARMRAEAAAAAAGHAR